MFLATFYIYTFCLSAARGEVNNILVATFVNLYKA